MTTFTTLTVLKGKLRLTEFKKLAIYFSNISHLVMLAKSQSCILLDAPSQALNLYVYVICQQQKSKVGVCTHVADSQA